MNVAQMAKNEYEDRQSRITNPEGSFDNAGRWYPSDNEKCECCNSVRPPSAKYPYSLMTHCRTKKHVMNLFNKEKEVSK